MDSGSQNKTCQHFPKEKNTTQKTHIFFCPPRNYNTRSLHLVKIFEKLVPHILQFSPDGKLLAVGFTNGHCKLLKSTDLSEVGGRSPTHGKDGGENGWWEGRHHQRNKRKHLTRLGNSKLKLTSRTWKFIGRGWCFFGLRCNLPGVSCF